MRLSPTRAGNFRKYSWFTCTVTLLFVTVAALRIDGQAITESPDPTLLNEPGSTLAFAVNAENWDGRLPSGPSGVIRPGSRVVVFVSGFDLLPREGANAFRVFAEDREGKRFRFTVDRIQRVEKRSRTYGLFLKLLDRSGYNGEPQAGELLIRVAWRGNASNRLRLVLGKREAGTSNNGTPFPSGSRPSAQLDVRRFAANGDRKRFMEQASFGPSEALEFRLRQIGITRWIEEQFALPSRRFRTQTFRRNR